MKIWILGNQGLLGKHVSVYCQKKRIPYVGTTKLEADITQKDTLFYFAEKHRPTHMINCSGYTQVDLAEKESKAAYAVNAEGPYFLGQLSKEFPMHVLHVSTDYVFDGQKETPYTETDSCHPLSVYGKSKREGEVRLIETNPKSAIVRVSWLFGGEGKNFLSQLPSLMRQKEILQIDCEQSNRPTYVEDLASITLELLGHSGIFHFANSGRCTRYEFAKKISESRVSAHNMFKSQLVPMQFKEQMGAPRPKYSVLDTAKIQKVLGKIPRHWEETIPEYLSHA